MMQISPSSYLLRVFDVDQRRFGNLEHTEVEAEADVLLHAQPERGDLATFADCGIGDLLDAMQVAGEAGGDDSAAALLGEQRAEHAADVGFTRCVTGLLGVGGVAHQQADAFGLRELADAGQVGASRVDRRQVDLEVAGVEHHTLRGVDRNGVGVRHRVGDRDELDEQCADVDLLAVLDRAHVDLRHQAGFFDAVASEAERERRAVDRQRRRRAGRRCRRHRASGTEWRRCGPRDRG